MKYVIQASFAKGPVGYWMRGRDGFGDFTANEADEDCMTFMLADVEEAEHELDYVQRFVKKHGLMLDELDICNYEPPISPDDIPF